MKRRKTSRGFNLRLDNCVKDARQFYSDTQIGQKITKTVDIGHLELSITNIKNTAKRITNKSQNRPNNLDNPVSKALTVCDTDRADFFSS